MKKINIYSSDICFCVWFYDRVQRGRDGKSIYTHNENRKSRYDGER